MNELRDWRKNLPRDKRSLEAASKLLGISSTQLFRYERDERRVAPDRVLDFERITGISRAVLRPDIFLPRHRRDKRR